MVRKVAHEFQITTMGIDGQAALARKVHAQRDSLSRSPDRPSWRAIPLYDAVALRLSPIALSCW
jgi:hypothetical protein